MLANDVVRYADVWAFHGYPDPSEPGEPSFPGAADEQHELACRRPGGRTAVDDGVRRVPEGTAGRGPDARAGDRAGPVRGALDGGGPGGGERPAVLVRRPAAARRRRLLRPARPRLPAPARLQRVRGTHLAARRGTLHRPGAPPAGRSAGLRLRQRARRAGHGRVGAAARAPGPVCDGDGLRHDGPPPPHRAAGDRLTRPPVRRHPRGPAHAMRPPPARGPVSPPPNTSSSPSASRPATPPPARTTGTRRRHTATASAAVRG